MVLADLKDLTITTASANANITLPNIDGTAGDGNDGTDLTILAGTGNVSVKSIDTDINDLRIDGTTITLTGDITTAAHNPGSADAASIDINGAAVIGADIVTSGNGTVDFSGAVNSDSGENRALTIVSGSGAAAINGTVGANDALGNLTINAAGTGAITLSTVGADAAAGAAVLAIGNADTSSLTLSGVDYHSAANAQTYTADAFLITGTDPTFTTANAAIKFVDGASSDIVLSDAADLTIRTSNGLIDIEPEIIGTADGANTSVTLNAGSGNIVLDNTGTGVIHTDIGAVSLTSTGTITISDGITTDGENINFVGNVVLNSSGGTVAISSGTGGGDIDFSATIDGTTAGANAENLTILSGTGTTVIDSNIGATTAVGDLTIGASGTGAITLSGNVGADATTAGAAVVAIGNADTASITFGGVEFTTSDTQTFIADAYAINGTDSTFSSSNDNIKFTDGGADGEIVLADAADLTITTEVGGSGGGTITVEVPILGTAVVLRQM